MNSESWLVRLQGCKLKASTAFTRNDHGSTSVDPKFLIVLCPQLLDSQRSVLRPDVSPPVAPVIHSLCKLGLD